MYTDFDVQLLQVIVPLIPSWISYPFTDFDTVMQASSGEYYVLVTTMKDKSRLLYLWLLMVNGLRDDMKIRAIVTHPDLKLEGPDTVMMQVGNVINTSSSKGDSYIVTSVNDYLSTYAYESSIYDETSSPVIQYACAFMGVNYSSAQTPMWDTGLNNPESLDPLAALLPIDVNTTLMLRQVFDTNYPIVLIACVLASEEKWTLNLTPLQRKLYTKDTPFKTRLFMADEYVRTGNAPVPSSFVNNYNIYSKEVPGDYMSYSVILDRLSLLPRVDVSDITLSMDDTLPLIEKKDVIILSHSGEIITNYL